MSTSRRPSRKAYLMVTGFAVLLVIFPFLFWYWTWFGRRLSDAQIDDYFADAGKPRHAQHALVQLGERLSSGRNVSRWYPAVLREAASPNRDLRLTAAWIMGQDRNYAPFHEALLGLLHDPDPMVRRNAAPALAAFGDSAARPELVAMLQPFTVTAPVAGTLHWRLKLTDFVNPGTLVAHIGETEVRASVPGEVRELDRKEGAAVKAGDSLVELSPDRSHVWEALRGLYLVGNASDLDAVDRFTRPVAGMPEVVVRQAQSTREAIQAR
jgi:biotin carboxyl carrier protein